jgi:hypothetical protein
MMVFCLLDPFEPSSKPLNLRKPLRILASPTTLDWNHLIGWLTRLDSLRQAIVLESQ